MTKKEPNDDKSGFIYDTVREDGRLERTCPHGVGHTVGHKDWKQLGNLYTWVHGCDGCCRDYKRMVM